MALPFPNWSITDLEPQRGKHTRGEERRSEAITSKHGEQTDA